ncbi:L,D-transpeptidase family protein [Halomonas marinisediminis]|uniref:LysM peptidoglycan-binding domain-containing protein n=1 Tax=Halomonas marinisediminis TaxID=2546095 RepID=A0ABY2D395_9GAMM|nr:L,D-transpeptidase family protein [Halomonas marinisediminis]TDA95505.1 LysM peptidoglycan-binding domain-containing protein [Halomonas marinisediminis]
MSTLTLTSRGVRHALAIGLGALFATGALAATPTYDAVHELPRGHYALPEEGSVIGESYTVIVEEGDTLIDIAREHNVGYEEIRMANPDVSIWAPYADTEVTIPSRRVLPAADREGIVINLSELRLYYYSKPGVVETYPISVGREEFSTPVGVTKTTIKVKDPAWAPPASMRREAAERGEPAPSIVPAGPDNPLGRHAILLGIPSYLIHGTNKPEGVGMRVSRGCIRMFPEDIESLYERVPSGTQVNIIDQPFKAGWTADGELLAQSYPALEENREGFEPLMFAIDKLTEVFGEEQPPVDYKRLRTIVERSDGQAISLLRTAEEAPTPAPSAPRNLYEAIAVVR